MIFYLLGTESIPNPYEITSIHPTGQFSNLYINLLSISPSYTYQIQILPLVHNLEGIYQGFSLIQEANQDASVSAIKRMLPEFHQWFLIRPPQKEQSILCSLLDSTPKSRARESIA